MSGKIFSNKYFIIAVIIFLAAMADRPLVLAFSNDNAEEALEIYEDAKDEYSKAKGKNDEKKLLNAEKLLLEALLLVPGDRPELCYTKVKPVLQHGSGRWSEWEDVEIETCDKYYPVKLIREIRNILPPKILAIAKLIVPQGKSSIDPGDQVELKLEILNFGKSRAANFVAVCVSSDESSIEAVPTEHAVSEIMPGEFKTLTYDVRTKKNFLKSKVVALKVSFQEMFGFTLSPASMKIYK